MKKISKKVWIAIAVVVAILIAWSLFSGGKKESKVTFDTAKAEKTSISTSITATGTIEPVTSVTVGTQVSGIVSHLYVDYNSVVKKGQVIAELDRTNLISELNAQKASLASAQSSLNYQQSNFERYKTLYRFTMNAFVPSLTQAAFASSKSMCMARKALDLSLTRAITFSSTTGRSDASWTLILWPSLT